MIREKYMITVNLDKNINSLSGEVFHSFRQALEAPSRWDVTGGTCRTSLINSSNGQSAELVYGRLYSDSCHLGVTDVLKEKLKEILGMRQVDIFDAIVALWYRKTWKEGRIQSYVDMVQRSNQSQSRKKEFFSQAGDFRVTITFEEIASIIGISPRKDGVYRTTDVGLVANFIEGLSHVKLRLENIDIIPGLKTSDFISPVINVPLSVARNPGKTKYSDEWHISLGQTTFAFMLANHVFSFDQRILGLPTRYGDYKRIARSIEHLFTIPEYRCDVHIINVFIRDILNNCTISDSLYADLRRPSRFIEQVERGLFYWTGTEGIYASIRYENEKFRKYKGKRKLESWMNTPLYIVKPNDSNVEIPKKTDRTPNPYLIRESDPVEGGKNLLIRFMNNQQLDQTETAKILGVSKSTVSGIYNGKRPISRKVLAKLNEVEKKLRAG